MQSERRAEHEKNQKRSIVIIVGLIIFYLLFKRFIWDNYIVNTSPSDALKDEEGQPAVMTSIDRNDTFAVFTLDKGFSVYAVSRNKWGWSKTDQVFISSKPTENPFEAKVETLQFKGGNNKYDIILITTQDDEIDYFIAYDEKNEKMYFNKTMNDETSLYFNYSENPLNGKVTYEAYSDDDELLYRE